MNLYSAGAVPPGWTNSADPAMAGMENVTIAILDMNYDEDGQDYDPYSNQGGSAMPSVIYHGRSQFQLYRFVLTMDDVAGSVGMIRPARFTIDPHETGDLDIRKGQVIRITQAASDKQALLRYEFTVTSGLDSGSAFRRNIEAQVNLGVSMEPLVVATP